MIVKADVPMFTGRQFKLIFIMKKHLIILSLLVFLALQANGQSKFSGKKAIAFQDIHAQGLLEKRLQLSYNRLQDDYFQWESISEINRESFPGDAVGRCINGLALLSQALHQPAPSNLKDIMANYHELENSEGYFGALLPASRANEDVMAGHNGLLCGLTEYVLWTHDAKATQRLKSVIDSLIIPVRKAIKFYRVDSEEGKKMNWVLSGGDIGQLFLALDGMTRAYTVYPCAGLKATIETAIDRYRKLNLVAISAQTHAMLSATTAIARWYDIQRRFEDLAFAEKLYKQYRDLAMTETYENFNWFNKPEWTEACAVTDSYILSVTLWRLTGRAEYLEDAHHILFNGVLAGQLRNGGFGVSKCVCDQTGVCIVKEHDEAPFCCSMRGAEGLSRALQYSYFIEGDTVTVPFYETNTTTLRLQNGNCTIKETSRYPYEGQVKFEVIESTVSGKTTMQFFAPSWIAPGGFTMKINGKATNWQASSSFIKLNLKLSKGTTVELSFKQKQGATTALHPGKSPGAVRYLNGPLLLGSTTETADEPFVPVLDLAEKGGQGFVYFPKVKPQTKYETSNGQDISGTENDCVIYRSNLPEEMVTSEMQKLFADLKYDRNSVIFCYSWNTPQGITQLILQWPETAEMPGPENVVLEWTESGNKLSNSKPGIIGNGRQWVYSLYTPDKTKAINNLVLRLKSQDIPLGKIGSPKTSLIKK